MWYLAQKWFSISYIQSKSETQFQLQYKQTYDHKCNTFTILVAKWLPHRKALVWWPTWEGTFVKLMTWCDSLKDALDFFPSFPSSLLSLSLNEVQEATLLRLWPSALLARTIIIHNAPSNWTKCFFLFLSNIHQLWMLRPKSVGNWVSFVLLRYSIKYRICLFGK